MTVANRVLAEKLLHDLSQPLTALECGLELGLRQDRTVAEYRARITTLLEISQMMHQLLKQLQTVVAVWESPCSRRALSTDNAISDEIPCILPSNF